MKTVPLYPNSEPLQLDADASALDLADMIDRRLAQSEGIAALICAYNRNDPTVDLPDAALAGAGWAILDMLQEIRVYSNSLRRRALPAPDVQAIRPGA